ncbi:transmembrane 9 superfamily member 2-like isoform X2 [Monodelphis domestica]|uniref:transmembrane 9 superfamily member 2-like isoform X2 n=1 Tax=Monodelphis domestica TaxID=13616 RepID=UPI0024E1C1B0|nr:transmembrane 9 superfamily member 2-like isoform X2 [Monodelphis domestica]
MSAPAKHGRLLRRSPSGTGTRRLLLVMLFAGAAPWRSRAFYLPGLAPVSFCEEGKEISGCKSLIELFVNRLDSVESVLPYEYDAFDFCQDSEEKRPSENLGQVLFGERIASSPYKFTFNRQETCKKACVKSYSPSNETEVKKLNFLKKGMQLNYQHHWIIDNMPVTWCYDVEDGQKYCNPGFPIGCFVTPSGRVKDACNINSEFNKKNTFYLFNHVDITITYHSGKDENWPGARLVTARLEPKSYKHTDEGHLTCEGSPMEIPGEFTNKLKLIYTYSVKFEENNNIKWASRWDYILESMPHTNIQWFSIMNSLIIVLFLSGMVAMIILRTLHKDIARYNQIDSIEDAQEEFGWKLVHGDVFRPPKKAMLLAVFLGQGTQIFIMTFITLFLACLGFLSPANRGALMTCAVILWVLLGTPAGYVSAKMYKTFRGEKWKTNVLLTALLCPGSHQMYYMFGFLFLVFIILLITCSEATVLLCYFHLCAEDYHWWWRAFLTSSFTAIYLLIYAVHYFFSKLQITGPASVILYFGYTMIMVLLFFLFTGTIGFFACFWFVSKIYSVVKVD